MVGVCGFLRRDDVGDECFIAISSSILFTTNLLALTLGLHQGFLYCRDYKERETNGYKQGGHT